MTDDFVTRGWASRCVEPPTASRRRAAAPGAPWPPRGPSLPRLRFSPLVVTLMASPAPAAAVCSLASSKGTRRHRPDRRSSRSSRAAAGLGLNEPASDSVGMVDTDTQALLRMDPATRRVTSGFPLGRSMNVTPGQGAMWVGLIQSSQFRLLRIDPRTNRVVARLRASRRARAVRRQLAGGGREQPVVSAETAVRIDPAKGSRDRDGAHGPATATRRDRSRWSTATFGCKSATGACCVSTAPPAGARARRQPRRRLPGSTACSWSIKATLSRVDPRNLHVLAHADSVDCRWASRSDGRLWLKVPDRQGDRVLTVDPRNGQCHRERPRPRFRRAVDDPRCLRGVDANGRRPRGHPGSLAVQASRGAHTRSHIARCSAASTSGSWGPNTSSSAAEPLAPAGQQPGAGPRRALTRESVRAPAGRRRRGHRGAEGRAAHETRLRRGRQPLVRGRQLGSACVSTSTTPTPSPKKSS